MISLGVLTPHATPGPGVEFAAMTEGQVITRIAQVSSPDPTSSEALRALARPEQLNPPAEQLRSDLIHAIGYASTTTAYVIGYDAEIALMAQLAQHTGLPIASTCAAALSALRVLDIERVALIGAPWFEPAYNRLGAAYFSGQGIAVVGSASAGLVKDPDAIEPVAVHDWVVEHVDDAAQAVFIGGNGFRTAVAVEALETTLDRPVLTANQVLLWRLLAHADATIPIAGYGRLFTHKP